MEVKRQIMDLPFHYPNPQVDDFLVSEGDTKTNSIYHIMEITKVTWPKARIKRIHMQVVKTDLLTMIRRDKVEQLVHPFRWYRQSQKRK